MVRAVIGETGDVESAIPSPLGKSSTGQFLRRFEEAALAAVGRWRFTPAHIRSFRPGDDMNADGRPDFQILTDDSPMKVFLDFRFVFEVRQGRGVVSQPTNADAGP